MLKVASMDPVALSTIISGAVFLGTQVIRGLATAAGGEAWKKIKGVLGFQSDPSPEELAISISQKIHENPELAKEVAKLLQEVPSEEAASSLVGNIDAEKAMVVGTMNVQGDLNF